MAKPTTVTLPSGITVEKRGVWLHESCPQASEHSPMSKDFNMNTGLSKTHRQRKHSVCGLWTQWEPRRSGEPPVGPPTPDAGQPGD